MSAQKSAHSSRHVAAAESTAGSRRVGLHAVLTAGASKRNDTERALQGWGGEGTWWWTWWVGVYVCADVFCASCYPSSRFREHVYTVVDAVGGGCVDGGGVKRKQERGRSGRKWPGGKGTHQLSDAWLTVGKRSSSLKEERVVSHLRPRASVPHSDERGVCPRHVEVWVGGDIGQLQISQHIAWHCRAHRPTRRWRWRCATLG
jgi:hypothetical protein